MEECQKLVFQVSNVSKKKLQHLKIGCVLAPHFENRVAGPAGSKKRSSRKGMPTFTSSLNMRAQCVLEQDDLNLCINK